MDRQQFDARSRRVAPGGQALGASRGRLLCACSQSRSKHRVGTVLMRAVPRSRTDGAYVFTVFHHFKKGARDAR